MSKSVDDLQSGVIKLYPEYATVPKEDRLAVALLAYGVDVNSILNVCPTKYTTSYMKELKDRYSDTIGTLMQKREVRLWFELQLNEARKMIVQTQAMKAEQEGEARASEQWEKVLGRIGKDSDRLYTSLERLLPENESKQNKWMQKLEQK